MKPQFIPVTLIEYAATAIALAVMAHFVGSYLIANPILGILTHVAEIMK